MESGLHIFAIHELTRYIKTTLERERTLQGVMVRGEISNCKYHTSGHLYFTLKDETSQLPCVMWRDRVASQRFRCDNGLRVVAEGSITLYERGGYYQLSAYNLQPDGIGNLYLAFEQLKQRLEAEGLFQASRKRALPAIPRCIALLTSPTGAVVHDFATVSSRRWRGRHVIVVPTVVQGPLAPLSIVTSLRKAAQFPGVDVIVLARGGGSFEELSAFNDEQVARTIADSPIPVVSAIGHETDFTIADFVADFRAPTPSAAAELVVPDLQGLSEYIKTTTRRIYARMQLKVTDGRRQLAHASAHPAMRDPRQLVYNRQQHLDLCLDRITRRVQGKITQADGKLTAVDGRIAALDPRGVLLRGYALVTDTFSGGLLTTTSEAYQAHALTIQFADGTVRVDVKD